MASSPEMQMQMQAKIYITGHRGMVGSAIARTLGQQGVIGGNMLAVTRRQGDQYPAKVL